MNFDQLLDLMMAFRNAARANDPHSPAMDQLVDQGKEVVNWLAAHDDDAIRALIFKVVQGAQHSNFFHG